MADLAMLALALIAVAAVLLVSGRSDESAEGEEIDGIPSPRSEEQATGGVRAEREGSERV